MKMFECWLKHHILFNEQAEVLFDESDFTPVAYLNEPISISSFVTDISRYSIINAPILIYASLCLAFDDGFRV